MQGWNSHKWSGSGTPKIVVMSATLLLWLGQPVGNRVLSGEAAVG